MLGTLRPLRAARGFTLVELLIVISVMAVLAMLAAPSIRDMILMQRLRGTNAQILTDLQFARGEATARSRFARVSLHSDGTRTCYVIYLAPDSNTRCTCASGAGAACPGGLTELRTHNVDRESGVELTWPADQYPHFGFDPVTGGLMSFPSDSGPVPATSVQIEARIDNDRRLRNTVVRTGRPSVCAPNPQRMGVTSC